jgi:hypothetical protein
MSVTNKMRKESIKSLFMETQPRNIPIAMNPLGQNSIFSTEGLSPAHQKLASLNNQSYDTLMHEDLHDNNFGNSGNSVQNSGSIDPFSPAGNESAPMLSQELKKLRLRISDYNKSQVVDAVC